MKLVMTLLVRDEEDIVEDNICFHLNNGVDFIVTTDNDSKDNTKTILEKYKRKGVLDYIVETKHTYEQDKWVSRMIESAIKDHGATHVLNCDADEFWLPAGGDLKKVIGSEIDITYVPVINYLPPENQLIKNVKFDNFKYIVEKTKEVPFEFADKKSSELLLYAYPMKIITSRKINKVGYGNDTAIFTGEVKKMNTNKIFIHHFPIRGYNHFEKKIINGGSAYLNNPINNPNLGWHWKAWYKIYLEGRLRNEYDAISMRRVIRKSIEKGIIRKSKVPFSIRWAKYVFKVKECLSNNKQ